MLVYLMGFADIFAAFMLLSGITPSIILMFTIVMLLAKAIPSFLGRFNPLLYFLGAADVLAIIMLGLGTSFELIGSFVLIVMITKAFLSFWSMRWLRNFTFSTLHGLLGFFSVKIKRTVFENSIWVGDRRVEEFHKKEILPPDVRKSEEKSYNYNPF